MFRSLASRLTFLYTILFAGLALIVFGVINYNLKQSLIDRIDLEFVGDGREFVEIYKQGGVDAIRQEIILESSAENPEKIFIRLFSPEFKVVDSSAMHTWSDLPLNLIQLKNLSKIEFETVSLSAHSGQARVLYQPLGDGYILQAGTLLQSDEHLLANFQRVFLLTLSVMVLAGVVIGYYISKRSLRGVQQVRDTADQISRGNLSQAISFHDQTVEINDLICSINRMQLRIGTLIKELQEVTNNIAHDLRSPITRIRGLAEITLSGEQSLEEYQNMSGAVIEECDSLVGMINTMLEIAETDARVKPLTLEIVDIAAMIRDVAELYAPVAEDKQISISLRIFSEPLMIAADRSRLQRVFANLLDNALKFTPAGGWVALEAKKGEGSIEIIVADSGIGIPEDDLPHVCERFYRADRSRTTPGTGLGLSLVQSIILAHNGKISLTSQSNAGTRVTIQFHHDAG